MSMEGAGAGAVVVTHVLSPVRTERWLYFKALLKMNEFSVSGDAFQMARTSPQRLQYGD